jgi:trehalose-6-phosphate synthase
MMTPNFIENISDKIAKAMGMSPDEFKQYQKQYMADVDKRLTERMAQQQMTPEVLAKRCTL